MHFLRSRICKLALISGALLGFSSSSNAQDITTGLLAHWKMDEISGSTIIDHSGNGHNGTWVDNSGNNVSDNASAGIDGGALLFDGNDDYISIDPLIVQNAAGTMSAWVKTSKNTAQILIFSGKSDEDGCTSNGIKPSIELSICTDAQIGVERSGQTAQGVGNTNIKDNKWHHIVGTWDSVAGEVKIYIDGVEENSTALNFTPDISRNVGYIGRPGSVTDRNFGGSMDDVRIYNRALPAADVTTLYQTGFPCENPNGRTGQLIYNSDHNTPQYCNGTKWISAGKKAPPLSGLVGHWKLDETSGATIADSSGNDYDGTWTDGDNNDVIEETAAGKAGASITFDGADDVINLGDVLDLTNEITICAWAKPENNTTGYIFGKYDANTYSGVFLRANTTGAWTIGTDNVDYLRVDNTMDFGVWQHVCGVISPSPGTSTLYKNGAALISNTTTPAHVDNARSATIGGRYDGDDIRDFEGQIDDVRIYNRALSPSEIAGIYGVQDTNCNAVTNGMVGHWKLDETSGSVILDSSGNGNSGTWTDSVNNDVAEETIAGQAATALTFTPSENTRINVPHAASLDISAGYTLSGWVYFDSAATGTITPGLISKNTTGGWGSGWVIGRTSAGGNIVGGKIRMGTYHNRDRSSFSGWVYPVDTWNYVTVTWNGYKVKYFLNGNFMESDNVTDIPDTSSGDLIIGNGKSLGYFTKHHGNIDDLRLYNYALTQTEITSLYGTYASVTCTVSTCDSPFSAEGGITYNTTSNAMQFCNGYEWMAMGVDGAGGGGCSAPSGTAGSLTYNTTSNVMQYCDGSAWHSIGQTGSNIDTTNGLVTHYKLDETTGTTVTDSSGNSYHGTMEGDLDADTDSIAGVDGTALRFAGTNITKIVGDTQDNMSEFTTCLWFNLDSLSNADGDAEVELINKGRWHLFVDEVATTPHLRFSIATDDIYPIVRGSTTLSTGQWYHACAIYNGVGTIPRVYLNGANDSTGGSGGTGTQQDDSARVVRIGAVSLNEYYANFPGIMDDVRIYNRELNQSEITALYEIGTPPPSDITSGLVAHWQLDETSGTTASDSAASNDGTMTNMDGASNTVSGTVSTALSFSSSRITAAAASSDIDDIFDGGGTISYWIYPTNWGTFGRVIDKSDTGTFPPNQGWHSQGSTGIIKFSHAFSTAYGDWETGANTVPMNTWSHIMITYNSSGDVYTPIIYINGVNTPVSTINSPTGTAVSDASQPITLGARQGGGNSYTGYIDDVRMYTRTLSATDAAALYNTGSP